MNAVGELKWLIVLLIVGWLVWLLTGGPQRAEERKQTPFIDPPTDTIQVDSSDVQYPEDSDTESDGNIQ